MSATGKEFTVAVKYSDWPLIFKHTAQYLAPFADSQSLILHVPHHTQRWNSGYHGLTKNCLYLPEKHPTRSQFWTGSAPPESSCSTKLRLMTFWLPSHVTELLWSTLWEPLLPDFYSLLSWFPSCNFASGCIQKQCFLFPVFFPLTFSLIIGNLMQILVFKCHNSSVSSKCTRSWTFLSSEEQKHGLVDFCTSPILLWNTFCSSQEHAYEFLASPANAHFLFLLYWLQRMTWAFCLWPPMDLWTCWEQESCLFMKMCQIAIIVHINTGQTV